MAGYHFQGNYLYPKTGVNSFSHIRPAKNTIERIPGRVRVLRNEKVESSFEVKSQPGKEANRDASVGYRRYIKFSMLDFGPKDDFLPIRMNFQASPRLT